MGDAATKLGAQSRWTTQTSTLGPFHFQVTNNSGVSFSWLSAAPAVGTVAVTLTTVAVFILATRSRAGWSALAFGAILGGAVGNLADRFGTASHHVVDFIGVGNLFVCNVADIAITFGVIVLSVLLLRGQSLTR